MKGVTQSAARSASVGRPKEDHTRVWKPASSRMQDSLEGAAFARAWHAASTED
jgi:hypothetical protein